MTALLKTYHTSQIIFREGLPGSSTYVVRSGKVEISVMRDGHKVILAILGEGALFGEMAPFDGGLRSATASASTACEVWCIRTAGFKEMVESCPPFIRTIPLVQNRQIKSPRQPRHNQIHLIKHPMFAPIS